MKSTDVYIFCVDINVVFIKRCRPFTLLNLYMLKKDQRALYSKTKQTFTPLAEVLIYALWTATIVKIIVKKKTVKHQAPKHRYNIPMR